MATKDEIISNIYLKKKKKIKTKQIFEKDRI